GGERVLQMAGAYVADVVPEVLGGEEQLDPVLETAAGHGASVGPDARVLDLAHEADARGPARSGSGGGHLLPPSSCDGRREGGEGRSAAGSIIAPVPQAGRDQAPDPLLPIPSRCTSPPAPLPSDRGRWDNRHDDHPRHRTPGARPRHRAGP